MSFNGIVSVRVTNAERVGERLRGVGGARRSAAIGAINLGAYAIHAWIVNDMNQPKSGVTTFKGVGSHTASAPGESPARDSGELVRKLRVVPAKTVDTDPTAMVISAAEYAAALEFGTERIAPRPYMRPAYAANIEKIRAAVKLALRGK
jgi:hypothetical protein